ncbi:MAG: hypothetical protein RIR26_523 [Pseudomonadota bacterium]
MSKRSFMSVLALLSMTASCQKWGVGSQSEGDVQSAQSLPAPLPVRGSFRAVEIWGFTEDDRGAKKPLHAEARELEEDVWTTHFSLDSGGSGVIEGMQKCTGLSVSNSTPNSLRPQKVLNIIFGAIGAVGLVSRAADDLQCVSSENGLLKNMVPSIPMRNFFGTEFRGFSKNLGFVGEEKSMTAADNECRKLRGWRYVNIAGAETCIGFRDALANKIRLIVIRPGDIHPIRIDLDRK